MRAAWGPMATALASACLGRNMAWNSTPLDMEKVLLHKERDDDVYCICRYIDIYIYMAICTGACLYCFL